MDCTAGGSLLTGTGLLLGFGLLGLLGSEKEGPAGVVGGVMLIEELREPLIFLKIKKTTSAIAIKIIRITTERYYPYILNKLVLFINIPI